MRKRYSATGAAALFTVLMLAGSAGAAGSPAPRGGPSGQPCTPPPHTSCKIVKGKRVCTTPPKHPVTDCAGG